MKTKLSSLLLLLLVSFILPASANVAPPQDQPTSARQTPPPSAGVHHPSKAQNKDGQAIELLLVLNSNEAIASDEALKKTTNPQVKKFARLMLQDHGKNFRETVKLSKKLQAPPISSNKAYAMHQNGKKDFDKLKSTPREKFDVVYIDMMIKGHEQGLKLIEKDLLISASNPALIKHLKATQAKVNEHLQKAREIQKKLPQH